MDVVWQEWERIKSVLLCELIDAPQPGNEYFCTREVLASSIF